MGNLGSQTGHHTNQDLLNEEQQWAHSFPRTQPRFNHPKVLPERDARQKLRHTNNGDILQSGGTLSGRYHHQDHLLIERDENYRNQRNYPPKTYLANQKDPLHKSGNHRYFSDHYERDQIKRFGSEPNLHLPYSQNASDDQENKKRIKTKKKYRAPLPPNSPLVNSSEWEENSSGENIPRRKPRIFKTRAETKKYYSSPVYNNPLEKSDQNSNKLISETNDNIIQIRERDRNKNLITNRLSLPELKSTKNNLDFHEELKEVTKRLKNSKTNLNKNDKIEKEKLKTLDHNISKKDNVRLKLKQIVEAEEKKKVMNSIDCVRGEGSGKESSSPEQSTPRIIRETKTKQLPKTFYFGMDENLNTDDLIDHFASNLHPINKKLDNSSESDLSSEIEADDNQILQDGIDLQLRPILPKKQLEIPRFSPAAAWRLLSAIDPNPVASTIASDDIPVFIEEQIEKYARPPPPTPQIEPRSTNDKSGDSGISGDAGPPGYDESNENIINSHNNLQITSQFNRTQGISWTPQQDLGDDSSMEDGINNNSSDFKMNDQTTKFSNKPHVFSLSLPRDNHLASYTGDKYSPTYSGLQKLKRSVSGVFGNLANRKEFQQSNFSQDQNDNWFFSKSAPNSLNNGLNSLEIKNSQKSDENEQLLTKNSKQNSGRVMYLPEFEFEQSHIRSRTKHESRIRSKSAERTANNYKLSVYSKSCENIVAEMKSSSPERKNLQDPPLKNDFVANRKRKKFTFQSTVRQIERKKLAEKLSKEAEKKEKQRLRELEAMQRVEEEFQKKRAREKANIRQQLRLFSMDDNSWSSLPPNLDIKDDIPARPEPDGAVSSSTPSPSLPLQRTPEPQKKVYQKNKKLNMDNKHRPSSESSEDTKKTQITQVLSEYKHPRREYKEYRGSIRYLSEFSENLTKQTTVHPQVTCNMPKAKGQSNKINESCNTKNGTNYRKDFAHGVKTPRSVGSTYSEDSQSRNNSPRMYHNKYAPITRF